MSIVSKTRNFMRNLRLRYAKRSSEAYIAYLRRSGIAIGQNVKFRSPASSAVDVSRPSLVTIGNDVDINHGFTLFTHDWGCFVFRNLYGEFVPSSGRVSIGNNIVFGRNVTILKGVTIGDNCIIGTGAVITHDIPAGSVVVGVPAKVICTIEQYYQKRTELSISEAFEYARSIQERFGRRPITTDFWEEFPLFVSGGNVARYPELPIQRQLDVAYDHWVAHHRAPYEDFEAFLHAAGIH